VCACALWMLAKSPSISVACLGKARMEEFWCAFAFHCSLDPFFHFSNICSNLSLPRLDCPQIGFIYFFSNFNSVNATRRIHEDPMGNVPISVLGKYQGRKLIFNASYYDSHSTLLNHCFYSIRLICRRISHYYCQISEFFSTQLLHRAKTRPVRSARAKPANTHGILCSL